MTQNVSQNPIQHLTYPMLPSSLNLYMPSLFHTLTLALSFHSKKKHKMSVSISIHKNTYKKCDKKLQQPEINEKEEKEKKYY